MESSNAVETRHMVATTLGIQQWMTAMQDYAERQLLPVVGQWKIWE